VEAEGPSTGLPALAAEGASYVVTSPTTRPASYVYRDVLFGIAAPVHYRALPVESLFSSVPKISASQLVGNYLDLSAALEYLKEYSFDDCSEIEQPVYDLAIDVAAHLISEGIPAPRVFSHGPKSIVFNWSDTFRNLYLTVSSDRISALISTPEQIKARINFTRDQFLSGPEQMQQLNAMYQDRPLRLTTDTLLTRLDVVE